MSPATDPGLCGHCANSRTVRSRKGSTFLLCELHRTDPRFQKYPVLPVRRCVGHEPIPEEPGPDD